MDYEKEIPFGAFDSELMHQEITIPEGFTATIDGDKIILTKTESEDEKIRKSLLEYLHTLPNHYSHNGVCAPEWIAWLEKQDEQKSKKTSIWKHWKDGICGNGEGKLIYLIKNGDDYSLSSSLSFECDYIELSDLDNLMLEKQAEVESDNDDIEAEEKDIRKAFKKIWDEKQSVQKSAWSEEDEEELDNVVYACLNLYGKDSDTAVWLRSLKQRIGG